MNNRRSSGAGFAAGSDQAESSDVLFLGVDGGGTKCRARLETGDGEMLGLGQGGAANPSQGVGGVIASIDEAVRRALSTAGLEPADVARLIAGVGLAGLHLPRYLAAMEQWRHPFKRMYLTDDLYAACLGAHGGGDGAVIVAGTGFSAVSIVGDNTLTIGGHGFLMGENCSGSWIGFEVVKAVLLAYDDLGPQTQLSDVLNHVYGAQGLMLADALVGAGPAEYAALAPRVFEAAARGDRVATAILRRCASFIDSVARRLLQTEPPRLSLIGGITGPIFDWLDADIAALVEPPLAPPEVGAIYFAKNCQE